MQETSVRFFFLPSQNSNRKVTAVFVIGLLVIFILTFILLSRSDHRLSSSLSKLLMNQVFITTRSVQFDLMLNNVKYLFLLL